MKILIATGIYPPKVGGTATYAFNIQKEFSNLSHDLSVVNFDFEYKLPTFFRHIFFFIKSATRVFKSDFVILLDSFSVGVPIVLLSKFFKKKVILRLGGDFLFESYLNRTGILVTYNDFYENHLSNFNVKEKIIFSLTKWVLKNVSFVVFSTDWQKDKFLKFYGFSNDKVSIIENFYGEKDPRDFLGSKKIFISGGRDLPWKKCVLEEAFINAKKENADVVLDNSVVNHDEFLNKIKSCYAVILTSISDISPNIILEAVRFCKPFIVTEFNGLSRLKDVGIWVDPRNVEEVKKAILYLADDSNYLFEKQKVENFSFINTWRDICLRFLKVFENIK